MAPNGPDPITECGPRLNRNYSAGATAPSLYSFQSLAGRSSRQNVARTGPGRLLAAAAGAGTLNQALDGRFGQILTASKESGSARSRVFPQSARQTYWNVWEQTWQAPLPKATAVGGPPLLVAAIALPRPAGACFPTWSRGTRLVIRSLSSVELARRRMFQTCAVSAIFARATETVPVAHISPELRPRRRRRARDDRRIGQCSAH